MIANGTWRFSRAYLLERWRVSVMLSAGYILLYLSACIPTFTYQCSVRPWVWLVVPTCCQYDAIYYLYWLHWSFTTVNGSIVQGQAAYVFGLIKTYTWFCFKSSVAYSMITCLIKSSKEAHNRAAKVYKVHVHCFHFTCVLLMGYYRRFFKKDTFCISPKYNPCFPTEAH